MYLIFSENQFLIKKSCDELAVTIVKLISIY